MEDWEVCAEAQNGVEAVEKHWYIQPHVTVMDFNMPTLNGLQAARQRRDGVSRPKPGDPAAGDKPVKFTMDALRASTNSRLISRNAIVGIVS